MVMLVCFNGIKELVFATETKEQFKEWTVAIQTLFAIKKIDRGVFSTNTNSVSMTPTMGGNAQVHIALLN